MTEPTLDLDQMMARAAQLARHTKAIKAELAPIDQELTELKFHIGQAMAQIKSDRTQKIDGYYALRVQSTSLVVEDEAALNNWLTENVAKKYNEYFKPDMTKITRLAEQTVEETGELIPGLTSQTTEYVSIREAKSSTKQLLGEQL